MGGVICFAGAPGVGKTTQAKRLHELLGCGYASEFARDLIARYGYPKHAAFQLHAAFQQRAAEQRAVRATGLAVTDTATWMCYLYPSLFNGVSECEQEQQVIGDLEDLTRSWHRYYSATIYLPLHDQIEDDGVRDPHASPFIDTEMRSYLAQFEDSLPVTYVPEGLTEDETHEFVLDSLGVIRDTALKV